MDDKITFQQILGIYAPWHIGDVQVDQSQLAVFIYVEYDPDLPVPCPVCDKNCIMHDHAPKRQWRHLDTCQYRTIVICRTPRCNCPAHGVRTIHTPWAENGSRFTAMFESMVLRWLNEASTKSVSNTFRLSWDAVDGIMQRGVKRGLSRRKLKPIHHLGIDEKAFQKHHLYSAILLNKDDDSVVEVLDDRKKDTLLKYLQSEKCLFSQLKSISLDMWDPFIAAFLEFNPELKEKMNFDRYHVAAHFSKAMDKVRSEEHRVLLSTGDIRLKHTRFDWLRNASRIDNRSRVGFMQLARSSLKTARAWAMKETASQLWDFTYGQAAVNAWKKLTRWMSLSRLQPMIELAKTIRNYIWGIVNAAVSGITNAASESKNAVIQKIKARACGYRSRERFRIAILFHLGKLDMQPSLSRHSI